MSIANFIALWRISTYFIVCNFRNKLVRDKVWTNWNETAINKFSKDDDNNPWIGTSSKYTIWGYYKLFPVNRIQLVYSSNLSASDKENIRCLETVGTEERFILKKNNHSRLKEI